MSEHGAICRYSLLIPNFELMQKILMLGDAVKVLKPEWLAKEVAGTLERAWKLYKRRGKD